MKNLIRKLNIKENEIQELKEENYSLKSTFEHFKEMIYQLVQFLMDKIFRIKDNKYKEFVKNYIIMVHQIIKIMKILQVYFSLKIQKNIKQQKKKILSVNA